MQKMSLNTRLIAILSIATIVLLAAPVMTRAIEEPSVTETPKTDETTQVQRVQQDTNRTVVRESRREEIKSRLDATKLRVCKKREKAIGNIMLRVGDRGTKQLTTFTKISERVQAFYNNKGLMLDDYDSLVSDVNSKKIAAESAIENTKSSIPTFKCDGTDPKGAAESFKQVSSAERQSLKDYKTAIKNLIVAVKSVALSDDNKGDQQ